MKLRDFGFIILGGLLGFGGFVSLQSLYLSREREEHAPTIAGQEVPQENFVIDFSRRYNLILSGGYRGEKTYENVKVLGYTGKAVKESSGSLSNGYGYFNRWLAIELPDGRRVYLSEGSIAFIEEVEPGPVPTR